MHRPGCIATRLRAGGCRCSCRDRPPTPRPSGRCSVLLGVVDPTRCPCKWRKSRLGGGISRGTPRARRSQRRARARVAWRCVGLPVGSRCRRGFLPVVRLFGFKSLPRLRLHQPRPHPRPFQSYCCWGSRRSRSLRLGGASRPGPWRSVLRRLLAVRARRRLPNSPRSRGVGGDWVRPWRWIAVRLLNGGFGSGDPVLTDCNTGCRRPRPPFARWDLPLRRCRWRREWMAFWWSLLRVRFQAVL